MSRAMGRSLVGSRIVRPFVTVAIVFLLAACTTAAPTAAPRTPPATTAPTTAPSVGPQTFSPALLPEPEITSITIAVDAVEANTFLPQLALAAGLYEKYGLTAEVLSFSGEQETTAAMISGQIQSSAATPSSTLTSMTTEAPLQDVAIFNNKFLDCIVTTADITDAETLRGKKMAISDFSGQSFAETVVALKSLGMTVEDVQVTQIGGQSARVSALQAGSVDSIPVDCVTAADLVEEGFRILLRLPDLQLEFPGTNIQFLRSFIGQRPNTVLAVTAAILESMQLLFTDEDMAVTELAEWAQLEEEDARAAIVDFKGVAQRDLRWTLDGYENVKDVGASTNPQIAEVDVSLASTPQFLDQLEQLGLNDALGIPE